MSFMSRVFSGIVNGLSGTKNRKPELDSLLEKFDKEINNFDRLILPAPESLPRTSFTTNLPLGKISTANLTFGQFLSIFPVIFPLMYNMRKSAGFYNGKFKASQTQADLTLFDKLEKIAKEAGASALKYVKVPRTDIFKHKGIPHEYAIVFTVEMDKKNISTAPSFKAFKEVAKGYKNLALTTHPHK